MEDTKVTVGRLIKDLNIEHSEGCGNLPIPSPFDEKITSMIAWFREATEDQRIEVMDIIDDRYSFLLIGYSERMSILAVREKNEQRILDGLVAIAIENFRYDFREDVLVLPLHYNSALKIGADARTLFLRAASYAQGDVAKTLIAYAGKKPEMVSIKSMGYVEEMTPEGFSYRRTW